MHKIVNIIGGGLAGCEAALVLARNGIGVRLFEMRPEVSTPVHKTSFLAELVCSNSLKSTKENSAAGLLKQELAALHSPLFALAQKHAVPAGGALAVNREDFSTEVTEAVESNPAIEVIRREITSLKEASLDADALLLATGPLTSDALAQDLVRYTGTANLAFFDAAAPIVSTDSLDFSKIFSQSRYDDGEGDYLNAPLNKEEYETFIDELLSAQRVIVHDFESKDLFQACQPVEEVARTGKDAPRFGPMKPVGIIDPRTGRRPWAVVQLRAENREKTCYNLVGFQTNLTFPEQARVFSLIPGLEHAEFCRYGVMHRNTFLDAPHLLNHDLRFVPAETILSLPVFVVGQLGGTEGYVEAIRSGMHGAFSACLALAGLPSVVLPKETVFGALLAYATNPDTLNYQPSHVNFGLIPPLDRVIKQKELRYEAYGERARTAMSAYVEALHVSGIH